MLRAHGATLCAISIVFVISYQISLVGMYSYQGMLPLHFDLEYWVFFSLVLLATSAAFPRKITLPSDFFPLFYGLISVIWLGTMWQITGLLGPGDKWLLFGIIYAPIVVFKIIRLSFGELLYRYIYPIQLGRDKHVASALLLVMLVGGLAAFVIVGGGSLNWSEMYIRRHAARTLFADNVHAAYLMGMATNGALPLVGFFAGFRRSPLLLIVGVVFIVAMFFLVGLKSPAINFFGLGTLGLVMSFSGWQGRIVPVILFGVLSVYILGLALYLFEGNMFLTDYLMRRISMVQPQVQSYFYDYWMKGGASGFGSSLEGQGVTAVTFAIGYLYMGSAAANANTNTFLYALGGGGLLFYMVSMVAVSLIFVVIDIFYRRTRSVGFFAIAALYAVLISEQAWTTSLATSGIALCIMLLMLFSYPSSKRGGRLSPSDSAF